MYFSLLSIILILFVGMAITFEVVRGLKRGFTRAAIGLATVLLSTIVSLAAASLVSDLLAAPLGDYTVALLGSSLGNFNEYLELMPSLENIVGTVVDILLTPILFFVFFLILRLVFRVLISMILHKYWATAPTDPRTMGSASSPKFTNVPNYEGNDLTFFRRHDRGLGAAAGALSGFLVSLALLAPLLGTLSVTDTIYDEMNSFGFNWKTLRIDSEAMDRTMAPFMDDVVVKTLDVTGGHLMYDAMTMSTLNDETVVLRDEVDACMHVITDAVNVIKVISTNGSSTEEQNESLRVLGSHIDTSEFMCSITADFMKGASEKWLDGELYLKIARPQCGTFMDPVMDQLLYYLYTNTEPKYVGMDVNTMLNVYLIAIQNGLLSNPETNDLMIQLDDGDVLNQIYAELDRNPRMEGLVDYLTGSTMTVMAQAIDLASLSDEDYDTLMSQLSSAVSLAKSRKDLDFVGQVDMMTEHAVHYSGQYGFDMPQSVAQVAITSMMNDFAEDDDVTPEEMAAYMRKQLDDTSAVAPGVTVPEEPPVDEILP